MTTATSTTFGDGATTLFNIPFPYLDRTHVFVEVDADQVSFTFNSSSTINISPAPALNALVRVYRVTPDTDLINFNNGTNLEADDLDLIHQQSLYLAQEARDVGFDAIRRAYGSVWDAEDRRLTNLASPVELTDAVPLGFIATYEASSLGEVVAIRNQLSDLNVTVVPLDYTDTPIASYSIDTGTMELSIPRGVPGPQGVIGVAGAQGIQGAQGSVGPTGPAGIVTVGDTGPQGIQGEPGGVGDKGPTGDQGPLGDSPMALAFGNFAVTNTGMLTLEYVGSLATGALYIDANGDMQADTSVI